MLNIPPDIALISNLNIFSTYNCFGHLNKVWCLIEIGCSRTITTYCCRCPSGCYNTYTCCSLCLSLSISPWVNWYLRYILSIPSKCLSWKYWNASSTNHQSAHHSHWFLRLVHPTVFYNIQLILLVKQVSPLEILRIYCYIFWFFLTFQLNQ